MHAAFLQDSILARAFREGDPLELIQNTFHKPFYDLHICYDASSGCFFIPHDTLNLSHPPILLDYHQKKFTAAWSFIIQNRWKPMFPSGTDRFVTDPSVKLENTMLFVHEGGNGCGVTVTQAIKKDTKHLKGYDEEAGLGGKSSLKIYVWVRFLHLRILLYVL